MSDECCAGATRPAAHDARSNAGSNSGPGTARTVLRVDKMDCPTEEVLIRDKLAGVPGIVGLDFNLLQRRLTLTHSPGALAGSLDALNSLGFEVVVEPADAPPPRAAEASPVSHSMWIRIGAAGVAALLAEAFGWLYSESHWLVIALSIAAVAACGLETYNKGWIALRNRNLNINALMSVAVTGAMAIGEWPEAAMVMVLFTLAELIEKLSLDRARNAIRQLMAMAPETATVRQPDGAWLEMEANAVEPGAIVRVRPGERIALDGVVTAGQSTVNQAPITGESIPVDKQPDDQVFAGTINEAGAIEYRVTARATNSTLARIIHAVEAAQGSRAPTQRFVDRFARIYTPVVFGIAILVAIVPPLAMGAPWIEWIYRALVLLVIACPCALVISTPVTIVSGLAAAARHGTLVKGGAYLEAGRTLQVLALDKTGTITRGKPAVVEFRALVDADADRAMQLAASLATRSDHPVSRAVANYTAGRFKPLDLDEFGAIPGRGVKGRIGDRWVYLGNHRMLEELRLCSPEMETELDKLERRGMTAAILFGGDGVLAIFAVADTMRESSRAALAELHGLGVRTVMLTGDNAHTARAIADQAGIDDVRAELLPEDKLKAVTDLHEQRHVVGMVGDGINDAPALARANIGFAMGAAGSDTALETADVALMDDDLRKIPGFIRLSRRTAAILSQNIALALGIKVVFLALTVAGQATMWMAVFADMGASLIVVFNGLRLLRERPPAPAHARGGQGAESRAAASAAGRPH